MTTNSIHNAFVNALLADATYVDGLVKDGIALTGPALALKLKERLTPDLAKYLSDHFEVVTQKLTDDNTQSGFDATVFKSKDDGQVYVSMRGSEGLGDFRNDGFLTLGGLATEQVIDMMNWWLKARAPAGTSAAQIKFETISGPGGTEARTGGIVAATPVTGDGTLSSASSVVVNGHSLGGHLATAFARLFGDSLPILHTYTYNSATFNPLSPLEFAKVANALGLGSTAYPTSGADTNFRAMHGIDVTTQNLTGGQIGLRMDLFNEESVGRSNHSIYKLSDALALGNALEQLDPTLTLAKLNAFFETGSNKPAASIESILDALRKAVAGSGVETLPVGDAGDSAASRVTFHATLAALQANQIFKDLMGKLHIEPTSQSLSTLARSDFGAFIALQDLSPLYVSGTTAAAQNLLVEIWQAGRASDYAAWVADKSASTPTTFTDNWITDRAALLSAINLRNQTDSTASTLASTSAPGDRALQLQWYGADPLPGELLPRLATITVQRSDYLGDAVQKIAFGDDGANALIGTDNKLGDHLYGGGGKDTLDGKAGDDYLEGNASNDTLDGGADKDTLYGEAGNDRLGGGEGDDTLFGDVQDPDNANVIGNDTLIGGDGRDTLYGGQGDDTLYGDQKSAASLEAFGYGDKLYGGKGKDTLYGGSGSDTLQGGADNDTYKFDGYWGKDTITDSGGQGSIQIDGVTLGKGIANSKGWAFDMGGGVYAGMAVYKDVTSSTGKKLIITKGTDTSNTIIVNNFDYEAATTGAGYLGITLGNTYEVALVKGATATGASFWQQVGASIDSLAGQASSFLEGAGESFTIYLNIAAKEGETLVLQAMSGLKAILGDSTVDANGATITLTEGQTQVSFALVSDTPITADQTGSLSVNYQGAQSATSNSVGLTVQDAGEMEDTFNGDFLVATVIYDLYGGRSKTCKRRNAKHYKNNSCSRTFDLGYRPFSYVTSKVVSACWH